MDYMLFSAKDYRRLFSAEQEEAYRKCRIYNTRKQNFLEYIRNHSEVFYPIVNDESGQYKYDMVNLLQSECDVLSKSEDDILTDIAGCVVSYYQNEEKSRIAEMLKDYEIEDRFAKGKAGRWDTYTNNDYFQIRFYRYVYSTNAAIIKIPHDSLMIIEGVVNYYICDTDEMCAYPVPKGKRKSVRKIKKKIA